MMPGKRCFFIGHRDAPDTLLPLLCRTIEQHIAEYSVTEFVVGHYGSFDHMAGKAVIKAKELYPEIALTLLLPYHPAEHLIEVPLGYDGTFYLPEMESVPRKAAIVRANRYMVDHSDYLIAYVWHPASNARNMLEYAQTRKRKGFIEIINLYKNSSAGLR